MKKALILILTVVLIFSASGCSDDKNAEKISFSGEVIRIDEFSNPVLNISIDDFNALGFELGDSLNVKIGSESFSNVPYYDSYSGKRGDTVVVSYPKNDNVVIAAVYFGLAKNTGISEGDKVYIELNGRGTYKAESELFSLKYSDDIRDFSNEDKFANARCVDIKNMKDGILYRSASPFDNMRGRADTAARYVERNNIATITNLAQTKDELEKMRSAMPEASKKVLDEKNIICDKLAADFQSEDYTNKVIRLLSDMAHSDGPYLVHCLEGKDRTGFVCAILEALCGAEVSEIEADYMLTYKNYYGIGNDDERYDFLRKMYFCPIMEYITGTADFNALSGEDIEKCAREYLIKNGLSGENTELLHSKIAR